MDVTERRRAADALRAIKRGGEGWFSLSEAVMGRPAPRDEVVARLADLIDPGEDVSVSAYDLLSEEERDAIAWVREHGGLKSVKSLLGWVVGHCSTRQQLDFDFWLSGRVMYELGFEEDMAGRDEVNRRLLARIMPEGCEWLVEAWPRFEDGEPLRIGDEVTVTVHDEDGDFDRTFAIRSIKYREDGVLLESTENEMVILSLGERVKRPAVLAADGEPLEDGQTAYLNRDSGNMKKGTRLLVVSVSSRAVEATTGANAGAQTHSFRPADLTHTKPEPPDSWERWRREWMLPPCDYCKRVLGIEYDHETQLDDAFDAQGDDLVRRARALAWVSE